MRIMPYTPKALSAEIKMDCEPDPMKIQPPTPFSTWDWTVLCASVMKGEPHCITVRKKEHMVAQLQYCSMNKPGGLTAQQPIYSQYGGFHLLTSTKKDPRSSLIRKHQVMDAIAAALEENYIGVDIVLPPDILDVRPFLWRGWHIRPRYSRVFDLANLEIDQCARSLSKQIRKAQCQNVIVEEENSPKNLYALYRLTFERQHLVPPLDEDRFILLWSAVEKRFNLRLFFANWRGKRIAGNAVIFFGDTVWDWIAGADETARSLGAPSLLKWHIAQTMKEAKAGTFDLCGTDHPTIGNFKAGFPGWEVLHFQLQWPNGNKGECHDRL